MDTSRDPSKTQFAQSLRSYIKVRVKEPSEIQRHEREMSTIRIQKQIDEVHGEISTMYRRLQTLEKQYLKESLSADGGAAMMVLAVKIKQVTRSKASLLKQKAELEEQLKHVVNIVSLVEAEQQQLQRRAERAVLRQSAIATPGKIKRHVEHGIHPYSFLQSELGDACSTAGTLLDEGYQSYELLLRESREKQQPRAFLRGNSMKSCDMYSTTTALERHRVEEEMALGKYAIRQQVAEKAMAAASAAFYRKQAGKSATKASRPRTEPNTKFSKHDSSLRPESAPTRRSNKSPSSVDTSVLPNNGLAMTLRAHYQLALGKPKAEPAAVPVISVREPLMHHVEQHALHDLRILQGSNKGLYDSVHEAAKNLEEEERRTSKMRLSVVLI